MKNSKLLIALLSVLTVLLSGCNPRTKIEPITEDDLNYTTITIEGSDYILYRGYAGVKQLTLKGNCKAD